MSQAYSDPNRESEPTTLPDVEVFYASGLTTEDGETLEPGYYYWFCFPGCLPDSEPFGPFKTEALAIADAQDQE